MMNDDVKTGVQENRHEAAPASSRGRPAAGKVRRKVRPGGKARLVIEWCEGRLAHADARRRPGRGTVRRRRRTLTAVRDRQRPAAALLCGLGGGPAAARIAGCQIVRETCRHRSVPNSADIDKKISLVIANQL